MIFYAQKSKGAERMKQYEVIRIRGHYEVFDAEGNFFCSADSYSEAMSEINDA